MLVSSDDGLPISKSALKKLKAKEEKDKRKEESQGRLEKERLEREAADTNDCSLGRYGIQPLNQSQARENKKWTHVEELNPSLAGCQVLLRGRVHNSRGTGKCELA
jgi:hypothetical protein